MSSLNAIEMTRFEKLLGMGSGYVLDFSDRTFRQFVSASTGVDIDDVQYRYASGSKANRLRAFLRIEPDDRAGKLLRDFIDYGIENRLFGGGQDALLAGCQRTVLRLLPESSPKIPSEMEPK